MLYSESVNKISRHYTNEKKHEFLTGATCSSIMLASLRILAERLVMNNCASCAHHQTGPVVPALHIMLCGGKHVLVKAPLRVLYVNYCMRGAVEESRLCLKCMYECEWCVNWFAV